MCVTVREGRQSRSESRVEIAKILIFLKIAKDSEEFLLDSRLFKIIGRYWCRAGSAAAAAMHFLKSGWNSQYSYGKPDTVQ